MVAVTGRTTAKRAVPEKAERAEKAGEAGNGEPDEPGGDPPRAGGEGSRALARYVRRPLWWLPVALFAGALAYGMEAGEVGVDEETFGRGAPLPARVADHYDGGRDIDVAYEHPTFGLYEATISLSQWDTGPRPEPGATVPIRATRDNPFDVRFPRSDPTRPPLWLPLLLTTPVLLAGGRRWWTARRAGRLLTTEPQAMLGRLRPRRRRDQTLALDLFPEDGDADGRAACSVPVVSSLGLPMGGGPVFPVEVHGTPRRFGRVVARVVGDGGDGGGADGLLWPRRRALLLPRGLTAARAVAVGGPRTRGREVDDAPPPLERRRLRPPRRVWPSPTFRRVVAAVLLAGGLLASALGTLTVLREADRSRSLPAGSVEAPAWVAGLRRDGLVEIEVELPPGVEVPADARRPGSDGGGAGGAGGEADSGRTFRTAIALPNAALRLAGQPLLVQVDPDALELAQPVPAPYQTAEPVIWTWLPAVIAALWLGRTWTWARAADRAAGQERWWAVEVEQVDRTTLQVFRPGAETVSCMVSLPASSDPPDAVERTLQRGGPVYAASRPAPGGKVVLRFAGVVVPTTATAAVRDRPWRRRWRALWGWTRRQSLRPGGAGRR